MQLFRLTHITFDHNNTTSLFNFPMRFAIPQWYVSHDNVAKLHADQ